MMNLHSLLFLSLSIADILSAGNGSNPSSPDYDWTDFLVVSPAHSTPSSPQHTSNQKYTSAQMEGSNTLIEGTPSAALNLPRKSVNLSASKKIDKSKKENEKNKKAWIRDKAKFETATPEDKERMLASKRERQTRYRKNLKQKLGHTSKHSARLAEIRTMEQMGVANEAQLQYLRDEREKNRISHVKSKAKSRDRL